MPRKCFAVIELILVLATFGVIIPINAFSFIRGIGDVAFDIFCVVTFRAFDLFDSNFRYFHFNNKIFFTFCTGMIVTWHMSFLLKRYRRFTKRGEAPVELKV